MIAFFTTRPGPRPANTDRIWTNSRCHRAGSAHWTTPPGRVMPRLSATGASSPPRSAPAARGLRGRCPSFRVARLGAIALAFMLAIVALPLSAAAQTDTEFVGNTGQVVYHLHSDLNVDRLQRFTTGSHPDGYALSSIQIRTVDIQGDAFSVSLCALDSAGLPIGWPNTSCTALTPPSSFAAGFLDFTAPANVNLMPDTTYGLLVSVLQDKDGNTPAVRLGTTQSNNEDAGKSSGWSIADSHQAVGYLGGGKYSWQNDFYDRSLRIVVRGTTAASNPVVFPPEVTSKPSLRSVDSSTPDTYGVGETIQFTVTFDKAVTVTGDPEFEFSANNPDQSGNVRRAAYDAVQSGETALVFVYTVQADDEDTNGIWIGDQTRTGRTAS